MYSLGNSAPIQNIEYNDVPIHNQYSNPERSGQYKQMTNYQFNGQVATQINNNDENYEIYQSQSYPSPSLFIEQDKSMSGYGYANNMNQYNGAMIQKEKFNRKQIPQNAPQHLLENFVNSEQDMNQQNFQETNRLDRNKVQRTITQGIQNQHRPPKNPHIPRQQMITNNNYHPPPPPNYLNVGSMPNIAGLYNQPPVIQVQEPPVQRVIVQDDINVKEIDDDEKTIYHDDSDDKSTKIKEIKKKVKNKLKKNKKNTDVMMYFVILLMVIIICLMLYIIMGKQKRVRF